MEKFGKICKEYMVSAIVKHFKDYPDFFITAFSQISAADMEKLRKSFKSPSAVYMVVKNSMVKRALKESEKKETLLEEMRPYISGSCGIAFSKDDPAIIARLLLNFNKEHETFKIQGGFIDGEKISSDTIKLLAALPPRDVILSMLVLGVKAPISGFVGVLNNLLRNLIGVIDAINKKKDKV
jgi:large subunit ribosomal protein L10